MKKTAVILAAVLLSGCSSMGLFGKLQTTDNALAVKYGMPMEWVANIRKAAGIPVVADLPSADRIVGEAWVVYYDMLDREEKVVDITGYHWGTTPRVRLRAPAAPLPSVFSSTPAPAAPANSAALLESLVRAVAASRAATNTVTP
jgi:hypothetical protein